MNRPFEYGKSLVVNYKLDSCCGIAPVRIALLFTGYFNIIVSLISLVATAEESGFSPIIMKVQEKILEDNTTKPIPILAYGTELGFSFLLLCAIYRNDLVLMRVYMRYCLAAIVMSVLVYSIVIAVIDMLVKFAIILSTAYQCYVILLVRSAIVEIKEANKRNNLSTYVMSTIKDKETPANSVSDVEYPADAVPDVDSPANAASDVESPANAVPGQSRDESDTNANGELKKHLPEVKLETVNEHPKE